MLWIHRDAIRQMAGSRAGIYGKALHALRFGSSFYHHGRSIDLPSLMPVHLDNLWRITVVRGQLARNRMRGSGSAGVESDFADSGLCTFNGHPS